MKILCLIPARKNSKGIKNKNLIKLNNKPLIYHTLKISNKLKSVYEFVSTDSKKIRSYSNKFLKEKSNYLRPSKISGNKSLIFDAVKDAINWLKKNKILKFDAVLVLQPTTPVRKITDIEKAIEIFKKKNYSSLVSLVQMKEHPYECVEITKNKWKYVKKNPKKIITGRQQYKNNFFFIDGSFYMAKLDFYFKNKGFIKENITKFYIQQKKWPVDIDYVDDLKVAEAFLKN